MTPLPQPLQALGLGSFCFTRVLDPGKAADTIPGAAQLMVQAAMNFSGLFSFTIYLRYLPILS